LEWPDGQRFRLKGTCSLGRTDVNDLVLPDIKVSRRHALIQAQVAQRAHELWLVDLDSRNGTFLNGSRVVRPTLLRDKDQLELGPYLLTFHQPNAPRAVGAHLSTSERTVIH
jgi:adenylate cyclase